MLSSSTDKSDHIVYCENNASLDFKDHLRLSEEKLSTADTQVTKGLAIITMLLLHLFCRKGADVYGTPLLWVHEGVPLVYYIGFLSEICVPLYCMSSGYAHYMLGEQNALTGKRCWKRILSFMANYWIICTVFSLIGILVDSPDIPSSLWCYMNNMLTLKVTYNGAWWYAAAYVWIVILSPCIYRIVKKQNSLAVIFMTSMIYVISYAMERFGLWYGGNASFILTDYLLTNLCNLLSKVIFGYVIAMVIAKERIIERVAARLNSLTREQFRSFRLMISVLFALLSLVICWLEKGILMPFYAMSVFILLHTFRRASGCSIGYNLLYYLGRHSTNIWLVHMFFYLTLFEGLAQRANYPILIFVVLLGISLGCSYIIQVFYLPVKRLINLKT